MYPSQGADAIHGLQAWTLALKDELLTETMQVKQTIKVGDCTVEARQGRDALWILVWRAQEGGFCLRTAYSPGSPLDVTALDGDDNAFGFHVRCALGEFKIQVIVPDPDRSLLRTTVRLTPSEDLILPFWPRDLYPIDDQGNPAETQGVVHAAQRGLCSGIVYLSLNTPKFGSLLYFQNLTALNDYFSLTETIPDGRVGGHWPELGYSAPTSELKPLPAGREIVLSDVFLHWSPEIPTDDRNCARLFLDLLAGVYRHLERPQSLYHDWPQKAEQTLHDLENSPKATVHHYGHTYLHAYTDTEYPDSMVQLAVLVPLREFGQWKDHALSFAGKLRGGVKRFFDPQLGTIRRYLPNVGKDKNENEVDSWYLYHPLANLGRLAKDGDTKAKELFLDSLNYGIKVARRFKYQWPVQFDVQTLDVITGNRTPGEPGQSDTCGLYAYVMLQAWDLTEQKRYLEEAKKAIQSIPQLGFNLEYQSNITAWGANACLRLWRITGEEFYREVSELFLASFFHNTLLWESNIAAAAHYPIFLGVTCLHDGAYMALYECFECYAAFHEHLSLGGEDLRASVRLLLTEYCKYTPSRAWFYYPSELPKELLATNVRNGHLDRELAFPMEDLYADGKPPGQVGQEIYGTGAAFTFTTHAYHRLPQSSLMLYCEYPIYELEMPSPDRVSFRVRGVEGFSCRARVIAYDKKTLPALEIIQTGERTRSLSSQLTEEGHCEFEVPGDSSIELRIE